VGYVWGFVGWGSIVDVQVEDQDYIAGKWILLRALLLSGADYVLMNYCGF
jgi:hypothetical protein